MLAAVSVLAGCSRHVTVPSSPTLTIYYCRAGSGDLVRVPFTLDPKLSSADVASYALAQLLAGPAASRDSLVLFPPGTQATVTAEGDVATVDLSGAIARSFGGGAGDEASLFKSLTYTMTGVAGIKSVQVLVAGKKQPALPGGHFEIDEPLTRATFAQ